MTKEILRDELNLIQDLEIKHFVEDMLDRAPQSYFIREASSTNKYHPPSSRGYQGLMRHVKRCVYIAEQLLRNDIYIKLLPQHDEIIGALILHDAKKYGDNNSRWSLKNHAELAAYWIADSTTNERCKVIAQLVLTHMGQWGKVPPSTPLEKFVHICDYIASLKELEREVDDMPVEEMAINPYESRDWEQLKLPLEEQTTQDVDINRLTGESSDDFLKDVLS